MLTSTPVQTTYDQYQLAGQVGMPATMSGWDIDTRIAEDPAGTGIGFGLAVCQGAATDKSATLGQLSGGGFVGITRADPTLANVDSALTDKYIDTDNMAVLISGDIWVAPATEVAAGGAVYFDSVTGELGDSTVDNAVEIPDAKWMTSVPMTNDLVRLANLAVVRLGQAP